MKTRTYAVLPFLAATLVGIAACDRSPVDPPHHEELGTVEIVDAGTDEVLATWTPAGWDETRLLTLSHGAQAEDTSARLGVRMWTDDGDVIPLAVGGEYSARYRVVSDPAEILDMDDALDLFRGDEVYLYGHHVEGRTGTAEIAFELFHGSHADAETHPIEVVITD